MVKLDRIYTRGGDKGMTSLGNGERVPKHDLRVEAYGAVDEANATIGLARLHTAGTDLDAMLSRIQNVLFDLGADLSTPEDEEGRRRPLRVDQVQVDRLEAEIDALNTRLAPLARSEEHTSELQSLMRISYAVFCLKKKTTHNISKEHKIKVDNRKKTK